MEGARKVEKYQGVKWAGWKTKGGWLRHRGGDEMKQKGEANDHPAGQQGAAKRGGGTVSETSVRPVSLCQ